MFTSLALIAAIGMPDTAGFIAELHILVGGFERWRWVIALLMLGVMISAAYAIRTLGSLFYGAVAAVALLSHQPVGFRSLPLFRRGEIYAVNAGRRCSTFKCKFSPPLCSAEKLTHL